MHLGIALFFLVSGQAGGTNDGGINDGGLAQEQVLLLQVTNAQHDFQKIEISASVSFGLEQFDQAQQTCPGHDLFHFGEEAFAACLLAPAGIFETRNAHLAHGGHG